MKKSYLFIVIFFAFSSVLYVFLNINRDKKDFFKSNSNNLEKIISDSINPTCKINEDNNYKNEFFTLKKIKIIIPQSRKWAKNLINAKVSKYENILETYKKRFNAEIIFKGNQTKFCKLPAKVRISGDWKDHIQLRGKNIISSLDVKLLKGNINGITKFKLFIPETRNGSSEVVTALFLKKLGQISPRTKFVNVDINSSENIMIFQEKASKELIENNKLRESAIIESDESLLWKINRYGNPSENGRNIFPKVLNAKWLKKGSINKEISLTGINIFSRAILESWNRGWDDSNISYISFSDLILSNGNEEDRKILSKYKLNLISLLAKNALINNNRKFYYDPINRSFIPIYYDGNSRILNFEKLDSNYLSSIRKSSIMRDIKDEDISESISEINKLNSRELENELNLLGVKISLEEINKIKKVMISNLNSLRYINYKDNDLRFDRNPLIRFKHPKVKYGIVFANEEEIKDKKEKVLKIKYLDSRQFDHRLTNAKYKFSIILCNLATDNCKEVVLNNNQFLDLLSGEFKKNNIPYYYLGDLYDSNKNYYKKINFPNKSKINYERSLSLRKFGYPKVIIDENKKQILITIKNFNDKVLITSNYLKDWNIKLENLSSPDTKRQLSRIDNNLLTSSLTIKDSNLDGLKIFIKGGNVEDSLNIVSSNGNIDIIDVQNSFQDAIDFDFSNLKINKIIVNNSGNDCLDLSSGRYFIKSLKVNNCLDKGVSAGENSFVSIEEAFINNTKFALVSKDSSELSIENGVLINNNYCIAAYTKKQEFGPAKVIAPKSICPEKKFLIQNFSSLIQK